MARKDPELRSLAANVRTRRTRAGLTQAELAERSNLAITYMTRIENAEANISVLVLGKLAKALNCKPWVLLRPAKFKPLGRGRPTKR